MSYSVLITSMQEQIFRSFPVLVAATLSKPLEGITNDLPQDLQVLSGSILFHRVVRMEEFINQTVVPRTFSCFGRKRKTNFLVDPQDFIDVLNVRFWVRQKVSKNVCILRSNVSIILLFMPCSRTSIACPPPTPWCGVIACA